MSTKQPADEGERSKKDFADQPEDEEHFNPAPEDGNRVNPIKDVGTLVSEPTTESETAAPNAEAINAGSRAALVLGALLASKDEKAHSTPAPEASPGNESAP